MNSNTTRVVAGIVIVVVAVILFAVLRDDGESASEKTDQASGSAGKTATGNGSTDKGAEKITTIVIKNGKPVGGITDLTYSEGEQVRFKVDSDVSDEVHMHGYDIMKDVKAGGSVTFDFPATIEGIFEAELENRGEQILELTVNP